jgi:hypothetical protein
MVRAISMACLIALVFGCATRNPQQAKQLSTLQHDELPPPSLQQPDPAAARESDVSPIPSAAPAVPPPIEVPAAAAAAVKVEQLGEISDSTPGAANIIRRPCDLENCGVVLTIAPHQVAESLDQDDGGPGVYLPQGMYSAETAGQPAIVDATGVQKIVELWDVAVQMRDGNVQVIQQSNQPLFRVGDPVLVNGNNISLWN